MAVQSPQDSNADRTHGGGTSPGVYIGPHNVTRAERGNDFNSVVEAAEVEDRNRVAFIEGELAVVDQQIRDLTE